MPINTNYTGDAGLGLGSSAAVPISTPDNLKVINDTMRDVMLLDADRNTKIYQQKVKDRDNLTDLILKNQVSTGDILPQYLPAFNNAKSKVEGAYDEWKGNPNDTKGFKKYQDAVTNLQDIAASGQTNTKMLKQLEIEKSKQPLKSKQDDMQNHIDQQLQSTKKDIHNPVTPYQQLHDLNMGTFDSYVVPMSGYGGSFEGGTSSTATPNTTQKTTTTTKSSNTKTTSTSTQKGGLPKGETPVTVVNGQPQLVTTTPDTVIDYNDILKRANNDFVAGEEGYEDQQQLLQKFENLDPTDPQRSLLKKNIDAINGQIEKYNKDRNLVGESAVKPVQAVDLGNGKYKINESAPSFAAKFALAKQGQFVQKGQPLFNKDVADYLNKKGKLGVDWFNAATKRTLANLKKRAVDKMDDDSKAFSQVWDGISNAIELPDLGQGEALSTGAGGFQVDADNMPKGFQFVNGVNEKGQAIRLRPIKGIPVDKDGNEVEGATFDDEGNQISKKGETKVAGYKGGYYTANYYAPAGATINGVQLKKDIQLTPKDLYDIYDRSGYKGSFKDFVNEKFSNKELDYELKGDNGKATRVSSYISQQALSNKLTKKGQLNPYALDESDLIQDDNDQSE